MSRNTEKHEALIRGTNRGSIDSQGSPQVQRMVAAYVDRHFAHYMREFRVVKEKVEIMAADRGEKSQAAVRRNDLEPITDGDRMESKEVSAAPTQEEFNALVRDVRGLYQRLEDLATLFR